MRVYRLGVLSPALYQPALIIVHITIADRNHRRHLPKCARYGRPNHINRVGSLGNVSRGWNLVWKIIVDTIIADFNLYVMPLLTGQSLPNMLRWGEGVNLITPRRQFEIG